MRNTLKISYSCYIKNPKRPSAHYYGRVRESGLPVMDIDLHTKVKAVAESWVALRRDEVKRYNQYVVCGEKVPADLERSIVRRNSPLAIAQKAASEAVNIVTVGLDGWEQDLRRVGRQADELRNIVQAAFGDEMLIPDAMDRLIDEGLI